MQTETNNPLLYQHKSKQKQPTEPKNEEYRHPRQNKSRAEISFIQYSV
jgi:hypothetical protein